MPNQQTIRLTIMRKIRRHVREGRPEIAVLMVALCSAAVTICAALIASILVAAVIEMWKPSKASYQECSDAKQQDSSAVASHDRVLREGSLTPEEHVRPSSSAEMRPQQAEEPDSQ
jgi:hypothetical protein